MKKNAFILLLFILFIGCSNKNNESNKSNKTNKEITIAVAANVQYAFQEIEKQFTQKTGIKIKKSVTSSGKLTAQIKSGAPFDVFLSANMKYPNALYDSGHSIDKPKIYAQGSLVLWTLKEFDLNKNLLNIVLDKNVVKIGVCNPKNAPYGVASIEALKHYQLYDKVVDKIVFAESISQVNQYIHSKAVDIGFTSKSVILSPKMKNVGKWIEIDSKTYNPINQGIIITKYGKENHLKESQQFYDFIFSDDIKKIFVQYGYNVQ